MKVVLFGATGMVGQGVLRECLRDDRVTAVLAVGRSPVAAASPELEQVVVPDLADLSSVAPALAGTTATFFCAGVSSVRRSEADYRRLTYDLTTSVGRAVAQAAPGSVFCYVSGAGTDDTERGRLMWARVKGATENALRALPLRTWFFRPGYIQPLHGIRSRTPLYAALYRGAAPLYPVLLRVVPDRVTTTEALGRAMISVAAAGYPRDVLTNADINAAAR